MEKYKEGIKWVGDFLAPGCLRTSVIILGIITSILFSCNDGGKIDPGVKPSPVPVPIDTIKTPDGKDSVIYAEPSFAFAAINEAVSKIQYVFPTATPIEMKEGDNYEYLQGLINTKTGSYLLPSGRFRISQTLKFVNSDVILIGSVGTIIDVDPGQNGVEITGGGPTIARIKFSSNPNIGNGNGVIMGGVAKLIEVVTHGFGGKGIIVQADVESAKTNASHSQILFCRASECGDDGLFFQGGDANACTVIGFDSRDNKGWGINDDSFLGNLFIGPMCHSNAKGHYRAENGNNRTVFISPYGEEDSPPSRFGGVTRVFGGLLGYEVTPDLKFYKGTTTAYRGTGGYVITSQHAQVNTQ